MKKRILCAILLALILTGQGCKRDPCRGVTDCEYKPIPCKYVISFDNKSDYSIDIRIYNKNREYVPKILEYTLVSKVRRRYVRCANDLCIYDKDYDSMRIYFNKGKADERYVTYKKREFKPRDIRDHKEYVFRKENESFHYTFTNADYDNAIKNQNATPNLTPPVPDCDNRPPDACVCYSSRGLDCVNKCK